MSESTLQGGNLPVNLSDIPGIPPPPGVVPNFDNPYNCGGTFTGVSTAIVVTMIILVLCRAYTKHFIIRKWAWDDLTCFLGALTAITYYINCLYEVKMGTAGVHQWDVRLSHLASNKFLVPSYLGTILVPPAMIFTKLTFFLMYLNIFWPFKWMRICVYLGATVATVFYVATEIFWIVSMTPRKGQTFLEVASSPAEFAVLKLSAPVAAVGLGIDAYLFILPITAVIQLQLPTRRKIGVMLIFSTGIAACISSAISIYYRVLLNRSADVTWNLMPVNVLTIAEMSIGLCCVSMPALSKLLGHHLPLVKKLKQWIDSRHYFTKSTTTKSSVRKTPRLGRGLLCKKTKKPAHDCYQDIEGSSAVQLGPGVPRSQPEEGSIEESARSFIRLGGNNMIVDDGIQIEVEMQQHSWQRGHR